MPDGRIDYNLIRDIGGARARGAAQATSQLTQEAQLTDYLAQTGAKARAAGGDLTGFYEQETEAANYQRDLETNLPLLMQGMRAGNEEFVQKVNADMKAKYPTLHKTEIAGLVPGQKLDLVSIQSGADVLKQDPNLEGRIDPTASYQVSTSLGADGQAQVTGIKPAEIGGIGGKAEVQSSKILPGGLTQIVRKDGTVEIVSSSQADSELVMQAERRGASLQGLRAGEREVAKSASKASEGAFKRLEPIKANIRNMDEGIRLIDEGAETGVIARRLPSIRSASIKLNNLQDRLGLDVIGNTTFGALSESELKFALDTALPTRLEGPALKEWLKGKREAQSKLTQYLEEAAIYLGTPGNTIAKYLNRKKQQSPKEQITKADTFVPAQILPQGVTEDDIIETMSANNMTRQQVFDRLGGR